MYTRLATSTGASVYYISFMSPKTSPRHYHPSIMETRKAEAIQLVINTFQAVLTIITSCSHVKREVDIKILNRKMTKLIIKVYRKQLIKPKTWLFKGVSEILDFGFVTFW